MRTDWLATCIGAVVAGGVGLLLRGPIYGMLPGAVMGGCVAMVIGYPLTRIADRRRDSLRVVVAPVVAALLVLGVLKRPSAESIVRQYLGIELADQGAEARAFYRYSRDSVIGVRFRVDEAKLDAMGKRCALREDKDPRALSQDMLRAFHPPSWWRPDEIKRARTWTEVSPDVNPFILVRYDEGTGVCYLIVMWW